MHLDNLTVNIFADGADLAIMREMRNLPIVKGFTTNPSLCRKAGVSDYLGFARAAVEEFPDVPLSFEVIADDSENIIRQSRLLAELGQNIRVKIPILNCSGEYNSQVISALSSEGIKLNVTACLTDRHVDIALDSLSHSCPSYISVFAGRIADSGRSPLPTMRYAVNAAHTSGKPVQIIWASVRELYNIIQADSTGVHIITVFSDWLKKLDRIGCDLHQLAIETTQMFASDAEKAGYFL